MEPRRVAQTMIRENHPRHCCCTHLILLGSTLVSSTIKNASDLHPDLTRFTGLTIFIQGKPRLLGRSNLHLEWRETLELRRSRVDHDFP